MELLYDTSWYSVAETIYSTIFKFLVQLFSHSFPCLSHSYLNHGSLDSWMGSGFATFQKLGPLGYSPLVCESGIGFVNGFQFYDWNNIANEEGMGNGKKQASHQLIGPVCHLIITNPHQPAICWIISFLFCSNPPPVQLQSQTCSHPYLSGQLLGDCALGRAGDEHVLRTTTGPLAQQLANYYLATNQSAARAQAQLVFLFPCLQNLQRFNSCFSCLASLTLRHKLFQRVFFHLFWDGLGEKIGGGLLSSDT